MTKRVTVIGAGVIGLSIAHEFAAAGDTVTVVADHETMDTVSAVAAAVWFPFHSEDSPLADQLLTRSLARFTELTRVSAAGVHLAVGTIVERTSTPDRHWTSFLSDAIEATPAQLPDEAISGMRVSAPFIQTPRYLPWLKAQAAQLGVSFQSRTITSLHEVAVADTCDLVIVATGIRGGELCGGDTEIFPIRGQVVRLENPGITEWIIDEDHPEGLTYVFPREHDVLVGGSAVEGDWDMQLRADEQRAILERAGAIIPELVGQPILGGAVGLRPGRPTIRFDQITSEAVPVITAYGHGGAGVTLSWGTAEHVVQLAHEHRH